jgi:hypothetical protein
MKITVFLYMTPCSLAECVTQSHIQEDTEFVLCLFLAGPLVGLLLYPEDGGSKFLRDVSEFLPDYTASHPIR